MQEKGIRRLLAVTGFGTGDSYARVSSAERIAFQGIMGRAYADKNRQEELIMASDLDWTIARPGIPHLEPHDGPLPGPDRARDMAERHDLARGRGAFPDPAAEDGTFIREAPVLVR
jgi:hypothetical protein